MVRVRSARPDDAEALCEFRCALWSDGTAEEHASELQEYFGGRSRHTAEIVVAEAEGQLVGFAELSIHPYAEGCTTSRVGYLEGWFVVEDFRGRGAGRLLIEAAEAWARSQGCTEFASDTSAENQLSITAHHAVGFEDAGTTRCFRKELPTHVDPDQDPHGRR